jgi:acyl dehydratase
MTAGASQMAGLLNMAGPPYAVGVQRVAALDDLAGLRGDRLGVSRRHTVTQEQVRLFADATGDDPAWVAEILFRFYS